MSTSVGMKAKKKQPALSVPPGLSATDRQLEGSLLILENACQTVLDGEYAGGRRDSERSYWQQRFKNIVTPVSLALAEYKGPRRFHNHYRHRAEDESILRPVLEPSPLTMLAQVVKSSLAHCREDLVGIQDDELLDARDMLETALGGFLLAYREHALKTSESS